MTAPGWQAPGGVLWWARVGARVEVPNTPAVTAEALAPSFPTASALVEAPAAAGTATVIAPVVQGITPPIPVASGSAEMLAPSVVASSRVSAPLAAAAASAKAPEVEAITPVEAPSVAASASMLVPQLRGTVAVKPPPMTAIATALIPSVVATTPIAAPLMTASAQMLVPTLPFVSVSFDAVGAGAHVRSTGPFTWSHPFGTATATVVAVSAWYWQATPGTLTAKVGDTPMSLLGSINNAKVGGTYLYLYLFGLIGPVSGTQTISVSTTGNQFYCAANSVSYKNVSGFGSVATGLSLARVMGPPFCHEHGTGCFRLLAVVMVTDEMAAGQFGWSELTGFAGRGF
ncbi:hypothetical protein K883_05134 [Mycobacterium sp. TKK-01-0059]|uniref:hypothetical protein n=1 Tax=Mycobacterium sp. TKK-01-0059 TaxID=1324269 RepID=UPI0004D5D35E|nr:hypothetical protein [Mycobacterium sp. TKK-01-0059]KEF95178.1 hypothetical protein K883_05134 [Mycobacterium sp. TKK-01-0059]